MNIKVGWQVCQNIIAQGSSFPSREIISSNYQASSVFYQQLAANFCFGNLQGTNLNRQKVIFQQLNLVEAEIKVSSSMLTLYKADLSQFTFWPKHHVKKLIVHWTRLFNIELLVIYNYICFQLPA